jgi:glycosyltransferase involved in cell wall biosynthesis
VLAEAQAYGIPAVSFDCKCGPRDIITNGEDGFLIPEGDVAALANGIHRLVNNDLLRRRMGVLARKHANRWDKEVIMQRWRVLFETEL